MSSCRTSLPQLSISNYRIAPRATIVLVTHSLAVQSARASDVLQTSVLLYDYSCKMQNLHPFKRDYMTFNTLGLNDTLLQAVTESGYTTPTPIQVQSIPAILAGKDVMAAAQTGTGKTAGFTLPILQLLAGKPPVKSNHARTLILTPTRELAAQILESIQTYGKHEKLRAVVVFGGVNINPQMQALRKGCDILVATPGRLLDLHQQNAVKFNELEILVLDEADRMLDMGFIRDIRKVLALLPKQRQNLMFSATFSDEIRTLAKTICHAPVEIDVAPRNSTVELITQKLYMANKDVKLPLLGKLLSDTKDQVLVFARTKHGANNLAKKLAQYGVQALAIHGNKSQAQRTKALADFKSNQVQVLVATDIAARGLDIDQLAMVVNFDLPQVAEDYVHRIGRTGRAGATGVAVSLVSDDESNQLRAIERLIKRKIEREEFDRSSLQLRAGGMDIIEQPVQGQRREQGQRRDQGQRRNSSRPVQKAARSQSSHHREPRQHLTVGVIPESRWNQESDLQRNGNTLTVSDEQPRSSRSNANRSPNAGQSSRRGNNRGKSSGQQSSRGGQNRRPQHAASQSRSSHMTSSAAPEQGSPVKAATITTVKSKSNGLWARLRNSLQS
jgi:ATP-dependent RNA helicase RhlE